MRCSTRSSQASHKHSDPVAGVRWSRRCFINCRWDGHFSLDPSLANCTFEGPMNGCNWVSRSRRFGSTNTFVGNDFSGLRITTNVQWGSQMELADQARRVRAARARLLRPAGSRSSGRNCGAPRHPPSAPVSLSYPRDQPTRDPARPAQASERRDRSTMNVAAGRCA